MTANRGEPTPERVEVIRAGLRAREAVRDRRGVRGIDRIEIVVTDLLEYEARAIGEVPVMLVAEPVERGGTGDGTSPLAHFLTGAASCLLNQFVRLAIAEGLPVRFTHASVRGEHGRAVGAGFTSIETEIHGTGSLPAPESASLVRRAEALCYVHNTLASSVRMTTTLILDGRNAARHESVP